MKIIRTMFFFWYRKKKIEKENFQYLCHRDKRTPGQCDTTKLNLCVTYNSITEHWFLLMVSYNSLFVAMDFCNGCFTLCLHIYFLSEHTFNAHNKGQ